MSKEYNLTPMLDKAKECYVINDYDNVLNACNAFIKDQLLGLNTNDFSYEMYRLIKGARTEIRKKNEQIKKVRITCSKLALEQFTNQTKTLEKLLQDADDKLKEYVDKYAIQVDGKQPKAQSITLTIKGDEDNINKVIDLAKSLNLTFTIKK